MLLLSLNLVLGTIKYKQVLGPQVVVRRVVGVQVLQHSQHFLDPHANLPFSYALSVSPHALHKRLVCKLEEKRLAALVHAHQLKQQVATAATSQPSHCCQLATESVAVCVLLACD